MKSSCCRSSASVLALSWIALLLPAQAAPQTDLILHEKTIIPEIMGQPSRTMSSTSYFSGDAMKRSAADMPETIIRMNEGKIITVDHGKKTYSIITIKDLNRIMEKETAEVGENNKEQTEAFQKMMGVMMDSVTVAKIGPGEPIAGYRTEKYLVKGMVEMEIWAAPDLKVPPLYYDALKMHAMPNPLFDVRKLYDEFKKIDGMTMKTVTLMKVMNLEMKTETVVTSVEKVTLPKSTFDIPAGYKPVEGGFER